MFVSQFCSSELATCSVGVDSPSRVALAKSELSILTMVALACEPDALTDPSAEKVRKALEEKRNGNPLSYFRLQHALSAKSPVAIASVLSGLMHFVARLHSKSSDAADIRTLIAAALSVDLVACATPTEQNTYPALEALHLFIVNLVSSDAGFVEPVLQMFAKRAFILPVDGRGPVTELTYAAIASVLDAYPRADALLASILCSRYPHPVRSAEDHQAYLRSVLHVARDCRSVGLCRSIIATVFQKLGAIEALVPSFTFRERDGEGHSVPELTRESARLEVVLLELFRHFDFSQKSASVDYVGAHLDHIVSAYEASIVPIEGTRFSPYVMLYATSVAGAEVAWTVVKRLRQSFLDPSISQRLREKFLQHSSVLVIRAQAVTGERVLKWVGSVATWLNRYIDAQEQRNSYEAVEVDTDVHNLFYCACCALMITLLKRVECLAASSASGTDPLDRMRLYRIMSCAMNPMLVLSKELVAEFVEAVQGYGMDFSDIMEENKGKYTPSRTKYGSRNDFIYTMSCPDLELPIARAKVQEYAIFDDDENDTIDFEDSMDLTPVSKAKPRKRKASVLSSKMPLTAGIGRLD